MKGALDEAKKHGDICGICMVLEELDKIIENGEHIATETTCSMKTYSKDSFALNITAKHKNMNNLRNHVESMTDVQDKSFEYVANENRCPIFSVWNMRAKFDSVFKNIDEKGCVSSEDIRTLQKIEIAIVELLNRYDIFNGMEYEDMKDILRGVREFRNGILINFFVKYEEKREPISV